MVRTSSLVLLLASLLVVGASPAFAARAKKASHAKSSKKTAPTSKKASHHKKSSRPTQPGQTASSGTTVLFAPNGTVAAIENDIAAKIGAAQRTLDVAMYTFESNILSDAVVAAHQRGVKVRVLLDSAEANARLSKDVTLSQAGVAVEYVKVTGGPMGNKFHHKFCVIDGSELITGSYNWTASADSENYENSVTSHDAAIVNCFVTEFDSLWTSKTGGVGSSQDVIFAPTHSHAIAERIAAEIGNARSQIEIAVYEFTSPIIADAVCAAAARGVQVWVLMDGNQLSVNQKTLSALKAAGVKTKLVTLPSNGWSTPEFHDKYAVIDSTVITGSFNWNVNQDANGYENVVVLHDNALANQFAADFVGIWHSSVAR